MTSRLPLLVLLVPVTLLLGPTTQAWPCSLVPGVDGPKISGPVGPSPLLISKRDGSTLSSSIASSIPIAPAQPSSELLAAKGALEEALTYFRPAAPLPDGQYRFGDDDFTVSSSAADEIPPLGTTGDLELYLGNQDPTDSCGDVTLQVVDLEGMPIEQSEHALFLVRFKRADGSTFSRLVNQSERFEANVRLRFFHAFAESGSLRDEKLCVEVSGVSPAGVVGSSLNLGCVDPMDGSDPRVFRPETSGCSMHATGTGAAGIWLLLGLLGVNLLRRRN